MKINLKEFENAPDQKQDFYFEEIIKELDNKTPVKGLISAQLTEYGVNINGEVDTKLNLICDRCLDFFEYNINVSFHEKFVKNGLNFTQNQTEYELSNENFAEELQDREEINVTDLIYQNIIINVPGKNLCDIDCKGTQALQYLNNRDEIDPRLEIFKKLSYKMDNDKTKKDR